MESGALYNIGRDGTLAKQEDSFKVGSLTSFEALVTGGDKRKEMLLRRSNASIGSIMADIVKEMLQHKLAAIHYEQTNNYLLFLPTMGFTLLSAIIAIFGTSEIVKETNTKVMLGIIVSVLQLGLSVLQSLSQQLNYSARAGFHLSCARTLSKLHQTATHTNYETRYDTMTSLLRSGNAFGGDIVFESDEDDTEESTDSEKPDSENDNRTSKAEEKQNTGNKMPKDRAQKAEAADSLAEQFKQALQQVDSFVPVQIANAFNVLESRIMVINESLMTNKTNSMVAWEQVLPALYFQLTETIIETRGWPFFVPSPIKSVEKALKDFKEALDVDRDNSADLLLDIMNRSNAIREDQHQLSRKREQREAQYTASISDAMKELDDIHEHDLGSSDHSESDPLISASSVV